MDISITNQIIEFSINILKEIRDIKMIHIHSIWKVKIHGIFKIIVINKICFNSPFSFMEAWYKSTKCLGVRQVHDQWPSIPHL